MKYNDSLDKSVEYLRLIIPLLSKHKTSAHPRAYSVWYDFISGRNHLLRKDIESLLESGATITDEQIEALYAKHVSECDEETMKRVHADMRRILTNLSESVSQTGEHASQFDHVLETYGNQLDTDLEVHEVKQIVAELSVDTRKMRGSVSGLQDQLAESRQEVNALRDELRRIKEEAVTDPLTGLVNRKGFSEALAEAMSTITKPEDHPCVLLVDIDRFKRINDTYGHLLGDKVIRFLGTTLKSSVKGKDTAARYGGEEFAILLRDTDLEGARCVAEQIRSAVEKARIRRMDNKDSIGKVTVSVGVARYRPGESETDLIGRADAALYRSKNRGRNRVTPEEST